MRRLVQVEARRMLSRRLYRALTMLALLGIAIAAVTLFVKSDGTAPPPGADLHARARVFEQCLNGQLPDFVPPADQPGFDRFQWCDEVAGHIVGNPPSGSYSDRRFHLAQIPGVFKGVAGPLVVIAWLLGASFIGAEWHAGTMTTSLTWEPRRLRLFAAKALALGLVTFAGVLAILGILALVLTPSAIFHGTTEMPIATTAGVALRVGALSSMTALIGFSIAAVARNTGAAMGVGFLYLVAVENLVRGLRPRWQPWLLAENSAKFITGDRNIFQFGDRSIVGAGILLAVYTLGLLWIAFAQFRRRDVA